MKVRVCSLGLVVAAILVVLSPTSVGAQPSSLHAAAASSIPHLAECGTHNSTSVSGITMAGSGTIEGLVRRQGRQTDHAGTDLVAFAPGNEGTARAETASDGSFSLEVSLGSAYTVRASYPGYLQSQKEGVSIVGSGSVDIGPTRLMGGDVNADNCVNILDIVSIIDMFGQTGLGVATPQDINDDGMVNIFDLTVTAGNFTRCGPTAWVP